MDNLPFNIRRLREKYKRIGIIIQCRDESTRMKDKSTRPFYNGKSILEIIIDKFKYQGCRIVVATTFWSTKTIDICQRLGIDYYPYEGDEDNVATRVLSAARAHNFHGFFRVCADNPFISLPLMYPLTAWGWHHDYIAFKDCMRRHEGFWMEFIKTDALYKTVMSAVDVYDIEHVTPFIIRNDWLFSQKILSIPPELNEVDIRLTVDTESDFKIAQKVYKEIGETWWGFILSYLKAHPKIERKMKKNIENNYK